MSSALMGEIKIKVVAAKVIQKYENQIKNYSNSYYQRMSF